MLTSFIRFLEELEHYKSFLFLKNEKIEDGPLKNQADDQPTYLLPNLTNTNIQLRTPESNPMLQCCKRFTHSIYIRYTM